MSKPIRLFALVLWLQMTLTACQLPPSETSDNIIRFGLSATPVTLDPRFATDAESARINRLLYQRLVDFDAGLRPVPALAQWTQLSPTRYRFVLNAKPGHFPDGQPVTAKDVKATYDSILDPTTASPHRGALDNIQEISVFSLRELEFTIEKPDLLFPAHLTLGILPAKGIAEAAPFNRQPQGSGDFELISWREAEPLILRRRADQQKIILVPVKDPLVRVLKLLRGELDILQNNLPAEMIRWLGNKEHISISKRPGSNFTYMGFNLQDAATGQLKIRQAVAHALNREEIIRYLMGDAARLAAALLPPTHWAGHPDLAQYPYNPDKARALLKQAGFDKAHPLRLLYKTSSNPLSLRRATVIQHQLKQVGIEVDLRSYDWGTFYSDIKSGRFQMYSLSWVGVKTPDIFRYVFHSESIPPKGANRGRYQSPQADQWIEKAEQADDLPSQVLAYQQLQKQIWQDLPYVPLWYEDQVLVTRPCIQHYQLHHDGNYDSLRKVQKNCNRT
ncbi:ABC transporter substrate-binding protein [Candidatus Venteria ishoeyi]|uniref:ABC transporter substrate-binding protein n=1 Tax=Candidatus Venteria ishoeyi TaxID=1899563 RepID=UPI0025A64EE1|nr:ABC transporter substrate-binding protein [Candidatus Venteria ishoeyi]MDM8546983.1 ABC transporter substrate-binding protein [Candidatus Venteria ishoeyi]